MQKNVLKRLLGRRAARIMGKQKSIESTMNLDAKSKKRVLGQDTKTMKRLENQKLNSIKRMLSLKWKWIKRQREYKSYRRTVGKRHFAAAVPVEKNMTRDSLERRLRQLGGDSLARKQQ